MLNDIIQQMVKKLNYKSD